MFREVELEEDAGTFIGPPPPAVVAEVESANEAERFEEVLCSYHLLVWINSSELVLDLG